MKGIGEAEKRCAYWLYSIPGIGKKSIESLLERYGSAEAVYQAGAEAGKGILSEKQLAGLSVFVEKWDLEGEYNKLEERGIGFVSIGEEGYPARLRCIPDAPYGLFYKGNIPTGEIPAAAVIGARDCSGYGRYVAEELGKALGQRGIPVISGMARGIDGISQLAALEAGGSSVGVLGCGVDICYPSGNRKLYQRLSEQGALLSEYPPGTLPRAQLFPPRNRIVSGLADAVVVVEAREQSGTLITVDMALEQGREVYVVPGRVTDRLSDGCNKLLQQGAAVLLSPEQFIRELEELFWEKLARRQAVEQQEGSEKQRKEAKTQRSIRTEAQQVAKGEHKTPEEEVLSCLDFYPRTIEQICALLPEQYSHAQTIQILMELCLAGKVLQVSSCSFRKEKP